MKSDAMGVRTSTARSRYSRRMISRVRLRMAGMSDVTKFSCLPRPTTIGSPRCAATILSGSSRNTAAMAHLPSISRVAWPSASSSAAHGPLWLLIRRATTSASMHPAPTPRRARNALMLLGLPERAIAMPSLAAAPRRPGPERRAPVSQLVWPTPNVPSTDSRRTAASRFRSFPSACHDRSDPADPIAIPAAS